MKKPQSIWNSSLGTHWVHGAHVKLCCTVFSSIYAWLAGQFMHRPCLKVSQFVVRLSLHWSAGQSNWTACMTRCVDSHAACMTCMKFLTPKAKEGQRFKVQSPLRFHVSALFSCSVMLVDVQVFLSLIFLHWWKTEDAKPSRCWGACRPPNNDDGGHACF